MNAGYIWNHHAIPLLLYLFDIFHYRKLNRKNKNKINFLAVVILLVHYYLVNFVFDDRLIICQYHTEVRSIPYHTINNFM